MVRKNEIVEEERETIHISLDDVVEFLEETISRRLQSTRSGYKPGKTVTFVIDEDICSENVRYLVLEGISETLKSTAGLLSSN